LKKNLLEEGWKQRIVRVRADYIKLCSFLEFYADRNNIDRHTFFDGIFRYSLSTIMKSGLVYDIEVYEPRRIPKGFFIAPETDDEFNLVLEMMQSYFSKKLSRKLLVCELTELVLYIYSTKHLSEADLSYLNIDFGIKKNEQV
jgi:hypothetical protein